MDKELREFLDMTGAKYLRVEIVSHEYAMELLDKARDGDIRAQRLVAILTLADEKITAEPLTVCFCCKQPVADNIGVCLVWRDRDDDEGPAMCSPVCVPCVLNGSIPDAIHEAIT